VWKMRRRTVVPALHKKYLAAMVGMFGECALHGSAMLEQSHRVRRPPKRWAQCGRRAGQGRVEAEEAGAGVQGPWQPRGNGRGGGSGRACGIQC
jgi:hypothetical protein